MTSFIIVLYAGKRLHTAQRSIFYSHNRFSSRNFKFGTLNRPARAPSLLVNSSFCDPKFRHKLLVVLLLLLL